MGRKNEFSSTSKTSGNYAVDGKPIGPSAEQVEHYKAIESRYTTIWPQIEDKLKSEARDTEFEDIKSFELVCISIPEDPTSGSFELSYETDPEAWHFTVTMENWVPSGIVAEC